MLTVPLGILKARKIEFQPALPKKIQASIGSLGYGTLDKIILLFPPGATSRLLPPDSEILHLHHDSDEERDGFRIVEFFNLDRWTRFLEPRPPYDGLIGFVAGRGAREMEKMTDKELVDIVLGKLRRCDPGLPDPIGHRITRWARDPFSLGSYSFRKPGSHPGDHDAFTQPMAGWLYFAGWVVSSFEHFGATNALMISEHTSDVYPGTMQGAYTTGLRVAGEISAQWLDSSLPASMRAQRHQATSGLPSIGMSGLPMPVSGIPDAMDKVMSGQDFMGGGKDADALLEALAKASPPLPGAGTKDSKKTVTKSKL